MNWKLYGSLMFMCWVGMMMNGALYRWSQRCEQREQERATEGYEFIGFWVSTDR